jgi:L-histidine N-alpha-methyltransferase
VRDQGSERGCDADFEPDQFAHVAVWDPDQEWIEMRRRARSTMTVELREIDLTINLAGCEEIRTEISAKFRPARVEAELELAGLTIAGWCTNTADDYALALARR